MATWHYTIDGAQHGPVGDEEMRAMLASGMINGSTNIWREGMETWRPLAQHPDWMNQLTSIHGTPVPGYGPVPQTNGFAISSLVCGLVSIAMLLTCWLGIVTGIPAVICGHMALSQMKQMTFQQGRGMAITGLITGYLSIGATVALAVVVGVMVLKQSP
ncbi:MAG: GYF domain-containing protein [Verrucomicrobiota bacterium]